jgi:hypothetical protein
LLLVEDTFAPGQIESAVRLMIKYRDVQMDLTLVHLAERLGAPSVLTLDERGFRTYRFGGKRRFHLVLQDGPVRGS